MGCSSSENILMGCCFGQVNVMDTLSRLSHDTDSEVAMVRTRCSITEISEFGAQMIPIYFL